MAALSLHLKGALPANATIGIVGGGQLGRMLAAAAARLGYRTIVLDPAVGCPSAQVCNDQIVAAYDDQTALKQLAERCDVVTYEFENVPLDAALFLEQHVNLYPPSRALAVSQDRLVEKTTLEDAGIAVAPFMPVETADDLAAALRQFGGGVLKTRRFGYDGKGQHVFETADAADLGALLASLGAGPFVLEQKIDFQSEFSIIAARQGDQIAVYDPATNEHRGGILRRSVVPANLSQQVADHAVQVASKLLEALDYTGVMGIEFFETGDGVLVNEFAPRVHNSGHWTAEACLVSQFEQHIRAIAGLPLGNTRRHWNCEMINIIGEDMSDVTQWVGRDDAVVTLYGKADVRPGRKMGHITRLTEPFVAPQA